MARWFVLYDTIVKYYLIRGYCLIRSYYLVRSFLRYPDSTVRMVLTQAADDQLEPNDGLQRSLIREYQP